MLFPRFKLSVIVSAVSMVISQSQIACAEDVALSPIVVQGEKIIDLPALSNSVIDPNAMTGHGVSSNDTTSLLVDVPGISVYGAGGISGLPSIHGVADDRLRIQVDGMDSIASCPNHMNSPLSYTAPTNLGLLKVYTGVTPVSLGGDSIGGTIIAETKAPEFALPGENILTKGSVGTFYRSNGNARGANVDATVAGENLSLSYRGSTAESDNVTAGGDFKNFTATGRAGHTLDLDEVGSSAYKVRNHEVVAALRGGNHQVEARVGYQDVPRELYPNQRMDMLGNEQRHFNLRYLGQFDWGNIEARAYHEHVNHSMDFGDDKQLMYGGMGMGPMLPGMPMRTRGRTTGVSTRLELNPTHDDLFRLGAEYQHYKLQDWWPAVVGSMGMGPYDFINIQDGERNRSAVFGEWERRLTQDWRALLGVRYEQVETSAGLVHGYNSPAAPASIGMMDMMNQSRDAINFNRSDRDRTDRHLDMTAIASYKADEMRDVEFGVSRKVRSPNLYERYTWSTANMMAIMNNYVGDGNGYIGDANLRPEKAYSASATLDWHAADRSWEAKLTPFLTYVDDYIDAVQWDGASNAARTTPVTNQFTVLKYANQSARLFGLDVSGRMPLGSSQLGRLGLKGMLNYTHGENRDTGNDLYNIMPLNIKLTLTQTAGNWDNQLEWVGVARKHSVSDVRNEIRTPGYGLVNVRGSYSWQRVRLDYGIENLFDKSYALPLGGAYVGQGPTMGTNSVPWGIATPGIGRSLFAGLNVSF